jgi:hypothetical protein
VAATALRRRRAARASATGTTTTSCPSSTPTLKPKSDQPSASRGSPNSRSTDAKPKPWTRPKSPAIHGRRSRPVDGVAPTSRLSTPTSTIESAISGSTIEAGGA